MGGLFSISKKQTVQISHTRSIEESATPTRSAPSPPPTPEDKTENKTKVPTVQHKTDTQKKKKSKLEEEQTKNTTAPSSSPKGKTEDLTKAPNPKPKTKKDNETNPKMKPTTKRSAPPPPPAQATAKKEKTTDDQTISASTLQNSSTTQEIFPPSSSSLQDGNENNYISENSENRDIFEPQNENTQTNSSPRSAETVTKSGTVEERNNKLAKSEYVEACPRADGDKAENIASTLVQLNDPRSAEKVTKNNLVEERNSELEKSEDVESCPQPDDDKTENKVSISGQLHDPGSAETVTKTGLVEERNSEIAKSEDAESRPHPDDDKAENKVSISVPLNPETEHQQDASPALEEVKKDSELDSSPNEEAHAENVPQVHEENLTKKAPIKILDLQQYFKNSDNLDVPEDNVEFIKKIKIKAETFRAKIEQYSGSNYSVDYFVIDETLMRLLETLDKIKCHDNEELLKEKIETIDYINKLHKELDKNVVDD